MEKKKKNMKKVCSRWGEECKKKTKEKLIGSKQF